MSIIPLPADRPGYAGRPEYRVTIVGRRWLAAALVLLGWTLAGALIPLSPAAAQHLMAYVPQAADATSAGGRPAVPATGRFPASLVQPMTADQRHWLAYHQAWQAHARDPAAAEPRSLLGLPPRDAVRVTIGPGTAAAGSMARSVRVPWRQPLLVETDHFWIIADLPQTPAGQLAEDLERFHAVWTQLFFPLWNQRRHWEGGTAADSATSGRPAPRRPRPGNPRSPATTPPPDKHWVVVLGDRQQYNAALRGEAAPVDQSVGYYAAPQRITYLLHPTAADDSVMAAAEAAATRYHELTHQLLAEATDSRLRTLPGERSGFWLAEGIACFMESTHIAETVATVGGWEASRLQFARHHLLGRGGPVALPALRQLGRAAFQRQADLSALYSLAAADVHATVDAADGHGWYAILDQLAELYAIRGAASPGGRAAATAALTDDLHRYLRLDDGRLTPLDRNDLLNLCLARCSLTDAAVQRVAPQHQLRWLDLTGLPLSSAAIVRLAATAGGLEQLSLEATAADDQLADWIAAANRLQELDLSWTDVGDRTLLALPADAPLETLWLTGSQVSDHAIEPIAARQQLKQIDLQQTNVSEQGLQRLRQLRPDLTINPLQLLRPTE